MPGPGSPALNETAVCALGAPGSCVVVLRAEPFLGPISLSRGSSQAAE